MKKLLITFLLLLPFITNAIIVNPEQSMILGEEKVINLNNTLSYPLRRYWFIWASIPKTWWKIIWDNFVFTPGDIWYYSWKMFALDRNWNIESKIIKFVVNPKEKIKIITKEKIISKEKKKKINISKNYYYLKKWFKKTLFYQNLNFHYYKQALEHDITISNPDRWVRLTCSTWATLKTNNFFYNWKLSQPLFTFKNDQWSTKPLNTKILVKFKDNIPNIKWCFIEIDKKFAKQWIRLLDKNYWKSIPEYSDTKFKIAIDHLPLTLAITKETNINKSKLIIKNLRIKKSKINLKSTSDNEHYNLLKKSWVFKNTNIDPVSIVNRWDWAQAIVNYFDKSNHKSLIRSRLRNNKKYFSDSKIFQSEAQEIMSHIKWLSRKKYFLSDTPLYKWDLANIFLNIDRSTIPINKRSLRIESMIEKWYLEKEINYFDKLQWIEFAQMLFNFKEVINAEKYLNLTEISNPKITKAIDEMILWQSDIDEIRHNWLSIWVFLKALSNTLNLEFEANKIMINLLKRNYEYSWWTDVDIEHSYAKYFALAYERWWIWKEKEDKINPENKISRFDAAQIIVRAIWKTKQSYDLQKNINNNLEIIDPYYDIDEKKKKNRFIIFLKKNSIIWDFESSLWNSANLFVWKRNVSTYSLISWMLKLRKYMDIEVKKE